MKNYKLLTLGLALSMYGCATNEKMTSISPDMQASMDTLDSRIESKKTVGHNLLSPNQFRESKKAYEDAMNAAKSGATMAEVKKFVDDGMMHLDMLEKNVELSKVHIKEVLDARQEAFNEGAYGLDSFKEAEDELKDLAENIEEKDINEALEDKDAVKSLFVAAEIEAIQTRELKIANENLKRADKYDGADNFDKEMSDLKKDIESSKTLISRYKDSPEKYMSSVDKAIMKSKKLVALSMTASWIENNSTRDVTMKLSNDLNDISSPLAAENINDLAYSDKVSFIKAQTKYVPFLRSELTKTQVANLNKKMRLANLESKNQNLNSELTQSKEFKAKLAKIRQKFSNDEAEVFMQGDKVIIRLVGLNFAVGKSEVPSNSKNILNKVAESIKDLNSREIEIQGHTDSTGGALMNEKLSEKRAISVNKFLKSKSELSNLETQVVGYGFRKPVNQNKSESGRLQNRRVDIVIDSARNLSE